VTAVSGVVSSRPSSAPRLRRKPEWSAGRFERLAPTTEVLSSAATGGSDVETIEHLHELAELGVQVAHGGLVDAGSLRPLELMAEQIIPAVAEL
jgi:hypothetical protein